MAANFLNNFYFWCFMAHEMMAGSRENEKDPRGRNRMKQISKTKINLTCRRLGFRLITIKSAVK